MLPLQTDPNSWLLPLSLISVVVSFNESETARGPPMKTPILCVVSESPVVLCQPDPRLRTKQPGLWGRHSFQLNQSSAECHMDICIYRWYGGHLPFVLLLLSIQILFRSEGGTWLCQSWSEAGPNPPRRKPNSPGNPLHLLVARTRTCEMRPAN